MKQVTLLVVISFAVLAQSATVTNLNRIKRQFGFPSGGFGFPPQNQPNFGGGFAFPGQFNPGQFTQQPQGPQFNQNQQPNQFNQQQPNQQNQFNQQQPNQFNPQQQNQFNQQQPNQFNQQQPNQFNQQQPTPQQQTTPATTVSPQVQSKLCQFKDFMGI
jgi:hypothetical protein